MSRQYGNIVDVSTTNIGENITADAIVGATSIPVVDVTTFDETGGQVMINGEAYVYDGIDEAAGTVILATGLSVAAAMDDRVEIHPPKTIKRAMVDLGVAGGEAIRVTVPHALAPVLGDGMREEAGREVVLLEERNIGEIYLADVVSTPATLQASGYVEGATGWAWDDQRSQVASLNAIDNVGAEEISARAISINGQDLETEFLDPLALGIIAWDYSVSTVGTGNAGVTEVKLFEFSGGTLMAGRIYRIVIDGHLQGSVAGDAYEVRFRCTTDGSTPTISDPEYRRHRVQLAPITGFAGGAAAVHFEHVFSPPVDQWVRIAVTVQKSAGTGAAFFQGAGSKQGVAMYIEDCGIKVGAADAGTLSQITYADATPSQPPPVNTYTRTYWSTYARSYDSDGSTRSPDGSELYQGYVSSQHGNTRSLFGFDHAQIQSDLAGATIVSISITFRVQHAYDNAGMTVVISSHNYSSKPSTWSSGNVNTDRLHGPGFKEGNTYTRSLPIAVGNEFKAGTTRGLGFGPGLTGSSWDYYGYMYGYGSTSRPRIKIVFKK